MPAWVARIMAGEMEAAPQRGSATQQELVANAKRYISSLSGMRIRLTDVGRALLVSPVYVTEVFQQVEGIPLY
jgi:AraC family transcriptional regulator